MTIDVHAELGALVVSNPSFVPVLESHRLDFCCQGRQSLAQACHTKGVDLAMVLSELLALEGKPPEKDWTEAPLDELIEHIQTRYHEPLRRDLPGLVEKARKVAQVHGQDAPELRKVEELVETLAQELLHHTEKEDRVLFPWISELAKGGSRAGKIAVPVAVMESEHVEAGALLEQLRASTGDYALPSGACTTYTLLFTGLESLERELHLHIHLENSILFPRALALAG